MVRGSSRTAPRSRPSPRSASRRRSGCAPRARTARRPRAGARRARRRRAASRRRAAPAAGPAQPPGARGAQCDPLAGELAEIAHARERAPRRSRPCWRARPSASAGRRSPGRAPRSEAPKACAERSTVPTLPGSPHAVQVHAQRPRRLAPALLVDGDHARARAERGALASARALDIVEARRRRARGRPAGSPRAASGPTARGRVDQILALGRNVRVRARSRLRCRRRRAFSRGSVGRRSGHRCRLRWVPVRGCWAQVGGWIGRLGKEKGRRPCSGATPVRLSMSVPGPPAGRVRQPTPRGRRRRNVGTSRRRGRRCRRAPCGRAPRRRASSPCMNCE